MSFVMKAISTLVSSMKRAVKENPTVGMLLASYLFFAIKRFHSRGQIYANLLEQKKAFTWKRVQFPQDWFGTPTWPPFHCFGTPIWPP